MNADLVSVVIPSYNHREFIDSAIASVIAQNYPAVELIVIDDGSTDGSPDWLRRIYGKRIAHLMTRENRGTHTAINEGIGLASGKYIAILNSDDVFEPTRLATLLESMQANDWDIAFSNLTFIDAQGRPCNDHKIAIGHARDLKQLLSFSIEEGIIRQNFLVTSSNLLIKREIFDRVGTFRGFRYCHDWDFLLRCLGYCSFGWVRQPLLRYRIHKHNTIR